MKDVLPLLPEMQKHVLLSAAHFVEVNGRA
jgi:hypothetical protein